MTSETRPIMFLEGERLYLRPLEETDLGRCRYWMNDPELLQFLKRRFPLTEAEERAWFERRTAVPANALPTEVLFAIVLKDGNRHIGNLGLHRIDWLHGEATSGTVIGEKDCWGKGYGSEAKMLLLRYAFLTLNLRRVSSAVYSTNPRSLACQKKCGYVKEGCRRARYIRDGVPVDEVLLGVLRDEWLKEFHAKPKRRRR